MSIFFLTSIEEKVFFTIPTDNFLSVTDIADLAKLPRTTVSKSLIKLENIGLVFGKKIRNKNKHVYQRSSYKDISEKVDSFKEKLSDGASESVPQSLSVFKKSGISCNVYSGSDGLFRIIVEMINKVSVGRIYMVQPHDAMDAWIKLIGVEKVNYIHETLKEKGRVLVSVRADDLQNKINLSRDIKGAYKQRLESSHVIENEYTESKLSLYVYDSTILFINLEDVVAFRIENKKMASSLKKMVTYMATHTKKVRLAVE